MGESMCRNDPTVASVYGTELGSKPRSRDLAHCAPLPQDTHRRRRAARQLCINATGRYGNSLCALDWLRDL